MEDSAMDMTTISSSSNKTISELNMSLAKSEAIFQENHELKKKIEVLEKVNKDLESDVNYLTQQQAKESTKLLNAQEELENANLKIKRLESKLEEERSQLKREIKAMKEAQVTQPVTSSVVVPDEEQLNILRLQIEKLEMKQDDDESAKQELIEERATLIQKLGIVTSEKQALQCELSELKEHLDQKNLDIQNLNIALESMREEKLLMNSEIQILKASDKNADRGNSLFAEVENNRQKIAGQKELLKMKYLNLKKMYNQKQAEVNKLKLEIVKIRREEKEDENGVYNDYNILIETYKQRIWELEQRVKELEKKVEKQPIIVCDNPDSVQWAWVNATIESSRKEAKSLQEELDRRGSNYVTQGHELLASQKENRKLKSTVSKLLSDIDELKLQLDRIKSAQDNDQDKDGISPPAVEVAIEYQKQKMVRFKEALSDQVKKIKEESRPLTELNENQDIDDASSKLS